MSALAENSVKENFPVTGLRCTSCAISIEAVLQSEEGVVNAAVNFSDNKAYIEYIPSVIKPEGLKTAVQSIGYDLMVEDAASGKASLESIQKERFRQAERNTWLSILSSIPIVALGMFFMHLPYGNYIQWALATPVVLIFGQQFFINAYKQARHNQAGMDTLVALSTGIAYLFSAFNTLYPQFWINRGSDAHVYFDVASIVTAFNLLGRLLEEHTKSNTSAAIRKLMSMQSGKLADNTAGFFVPVIIAIALFSMFTWLVLGGADGFTQGLLAMITVLIIACPCALGLASPIAIIVGISKGAENGILVKEAESLEESKSIHTIQLSRKTVKVIKQNLFWSFIYNIIGIPLASGILYPFTGFLLDPMIAGGAMALSCISIVVNSLRLKYMKI